MSEARTHHYCSPSRLERVAVCPGSLRMEALAPEEPPSKDAAEGTFLHSKVPPGVTLDNLDAEQREQVEKCRRVAADLITSADGDVGEVLYEQKLTLLDDYGQEISSGYVDLLIDHPKANLVTVVDWKFGRDHVTDPKDNPQVQAYGIMGAQRFKRGRMRAGVYQPRLEHEPRFHVWDDLFLPLTSILGIIEAGHQQDMVLHATPAGCKYCAARLQCPAVQEQELKVDALVRPGITLDGMLAAYEAWQVIERRGRYLEHIFAAAVKQGQIPGWTWREISGGREFTDPNAAYQTLLPYFPSVNDFMRYVKVSVKQVEDHVAHVMQEQAKGTGEKLTLKEAQERFRALVSPIVDELPPRCFPQKARAGKKQIEA